MKKAVASSHVSYSDHLYDLCHGYQVGYQAIVGVQSHQSKSCDSEATMMRIVDPPRDKSLFFASRDSRVRQHMAR